MATIHTILGFILIGVAILAWIWSLLRATGKVSSNPFRMMFIGFLDLEILLGILIFVLHPHGGLFLIHPLLMIVGVVLLHIFTKESRTKRTHLTTYTVSTLILIAGVVVAVH